MVHCRYIWFENYNDKNYKVLVIPNCQFHIRRGHILCNICCFLCTLFGCISTHLAPLLNKKYSVIFLEHRIPHPLTWNNTVCILFSIKSPPLLCFKIGQKWCLYRGVLSKCSLGKISENYFCFAKLSTKFLLLWSDLLLSLCRRQQARLLTVARRLVPYRVGSLLSAIYQYHSIIDKKLWFRICMMGRGMFKNSELY